MKKIRHVWDFLGSRNLSVYIFISGIAYYLFLIAFSALIPAWWVNNISQLFPYKVLYISFFINLIICEIKWIPVVVKRCRSLSAPATEDDLKRFRYRTEVSCEYPEGHKESGIGSLEGYLRRRGYKVQRPADSGTSRLRPNASRFLYASRGRFSPLGNLFFHLSFLVLLAGIYLSLFNRFESRVLLMEGQASHGFSGDRERVSESDKLNLSGISFKVEGIEPRFWKDQLLFTYLGALISHDGERAVAKLSKAASVGGANVSIEGISYAPRYILRELGGAVLDTGHVNLANFVPGTVDHFKIPGFPYKIYVSIYPDFVSKDGNIDTKTMNLANPKFLIRVVRGKIPVFSGLLGIDDEAYFDGMGLSFKEIKYNGTFHIVKDPGLVMIWTSFIMMCLGLSWKLLFSRSELYLTLSGVECSLFMNCDYSPRLCADRYMKILKGPG